MSTQGVKVRRTLAASAERVFAAFSDAALVARWLRPSPDVKLTVLSLDFRVGGAYRFAYDVPTGERMIVGGVYREIRKPARIVFTWLIEPPDVHAGIESEVTVSLSATTGGTEVVIRHDRFGRADANDRHRQGWTGALENLAAHFAARH
ncbi:MAG TPA: SRPBCC domain-containing protein [Polyangiaceae bacterium]|nr:SRPBCC domain-containing protein [Polyangiaceae bacterium]